MSIYMQFYCEFQSLSVSDKLQSTVFVGSFCGPKHRTSTKIYQICSLFSDRRGWDLAMFCFHLHFKGL